MKKSSNMGNPMKRRLALMMWAIIVAGGMSLAQAPPPPSENHSGQVSSTPLGGSAPLASAPGLMLALAAAYGLRKTILKSANETQKNK